MRSRLKRNIMETVAASTIVWIATLALVSGSDGFSLNTRIDETISCPSKPEYNLVMLNKLADAEREMRDTVHSLTDIVHSLTEQMIHCYDHLEEGMVCFYHLAICGWQKLHYNLWCNANFTLTGIRVCPTVSVLLLLFITVPFSFKWPTIPDFCPK